MLKKVNLINLIKNLVKKFSQIIQFLKNERKKTNDYQIKTWKEAKNENLKKIKIVQHKLTGFF